MPVLDRKGRIARARERAAAAVDRQREEHERRARLPEALCAACGAVVREGVGTVHALSPWGDVHRGAWGLVDRERRRQGLPVFLEWRRRHEECATSGGIVEQLVGETHPVAVAGAALASLTSPLLAANRASDPSAADAEHREPKPKAWWWVTDLDLALLRKAARKARNRVEPHQCRQGACGWCGRSHSLSWRKSPERWSDGTEAALCQDCTKVWDRRGRPQDREGFRACAVEALSGASSMANDGLGIRTFVDIAGDDHIGTDEPWTYAPEALERLREKARMTWPSSLPGELRDIYLPRALRQHREAYAAAIAEQRSEEQRRAEEEARAFGWPA